MSYRKSLNTSDNSNYSAESSGCSLIFLFWSQLWLWRPLEIWCSDLDRDLEACVRLYFQPVIWWGRLNVSSSQSSWCCWTSRPCCRCWTESSWSCRTAPSHCWRVSPLRVSESSQKSLHALKMGKWQTLKFLSSFIANFWKCQQQFPFKWKNSSNKNKTIKVSQ